MRWSPIVMGLYPYRIFKWQAARAITVTSEVKAYIYEGLNRLTKQDFIIIWSAVMNGIHHEPDYQIKHPLLITYGQHSNIGPRTIKRQTQIWAQRDAHCQYVMIPNAGHNAHQENPTFFNPVLLDFLHQHVH
jgi:pimeloyl-ACP methyl ester carboxylesterase